MSAINFLAYEQVWPEPLLRLTLALRVALTLTLTLTRPRARAGLRPVEPRDMRAVATA